MERFQNRKEAAELLADKLISYKNLSPLILAVPRGGVPIAFEVAKKLGADMDLLMVKKIGAPGNPELAIGAVSEDGKPWLNNKVIRVIGLDPKDVKDQAKAKSLEVQSQIRKLRGVADAIPVKDRNVIVVDDGIATGATILAAINILKERHARKIIVATPVAPLSTIKEIEKVVDEVVCLRTPHPFFSVGDWYSEFRQVPDDEVLQLLQNSIRTNYPQEKEIRIQDGDAILVGDLQLVKDMRGLVIFAHGSGSSRKSPRNRFVAQELNKIGFSTLLSDLLTEEEANNRLNVFDIELLIQRLLKTTEEVLEYLPNARIPIAYFGASTGAAAALGAAAESNRDIFAVVSRGGRPDLASKYLSDVKAPTLLIVGGEDTPVIALNERAAKKIESSKLVIIPGATHLFEEAGALDEVVEYAAEWFLRNVPVAKKVTTPKENILHEIEDRAHPIQSERAWDDLVERLAASRVVMLGEATHGSSEFYNIRRMISERLIRDHGFDFIAVEGDWPDCQKLNNYIQKGNGGSAKEIMRQFQRWPTWMWANDETASLIEWMKQYKAGFYGLDVYSLFESMDYVKAYAERISPELAADIGRQYACFEPFERNEKRYAQHLLKFDEGCKAEVVDTLRKLLRVRLKDMGLREGELFDAQQNARIVKNAEEYYRAMLLGSPESWNIRDHHMLETLEILLHRYSPDSKCIVWAHNSHIGDYHATDMLAEGYVNLGGLAREKFGVENVALVGLGTYQGQVLASPAWEGPETVTPLPEARKSSFEFYCHKVADSLKANTFYMLFDSEARKSVLGTKEYGHRAVGVVYHPRFELHGRNYVPTAMAKRYDAFVYVDRTSALNSYRTQFSTTEFPETWPGGI